jgi:hypothetical protein
LGIACRSVVAVGSFKLHLAWLCSIATLEKVLISASLEWTVPLIKLRTALRSVRLAAVL